MSKTIELLPIHAFIEHLQFRHYSSNSIHSHQLDLYRFQKWLLSQKDIKIKHLSQLTQSLLQQYIDDFLQTHKARTVARHLSSLKLFFHFLEQSGSLKNNPSTFIAFPEVIEAPPQMLSPQEVIALLEAPSLSHFLGLRDRSILELLYSSGLRVSELVALNVDDLFLDLSFLKIRGAKKERMVPMTPKSIELIQEYLDSARQQRLLNKEDVCLFANKNGKRLTRMGIWLMIKKHARAVGITSPINGRILRHSFAIHLLQQGLDLSAIKELFGYHALGPTEQYEHVNAPNYFETYQQYHPRAQADLPEGLTPAFQDRSHEL